MAGLLIVKGRLSFPEEKVYKNKKGEEGKYVTFTVCENRSEKEGEKYVTHKDYYRFFAFQQGHMNLLLSPKVLGVQVVCSTRVEKNKETQKSEIKTHRIISVEVVAWKNEEERKEEKSLGEAFIEDDEEIDVFIP